MGKVIAFSNQKGGSGKTTLSTNIAVLWSNSGYKVAVIDADAQKSLTYWLDSRKTYYGEDDIGITKLDFDIRDLIVRFVDDSEFTEFKTNYGLTMKCGWAKINNKKIGIVASNGVIFSESAKKATQFIQLANKSNIPLLFIHNTTGFMVGKRHEQKAIINHGAQLIHAVAGSEVPHITLLVGNSYGAGNYAMCGRSFDPRFLFAYPNVKSGVMGAEQLAGVMEIIKINSAIKQNKKIDKRQLNRDKKNLILLAEEKASIWHTTSEIMDDGVIDPRDTRSYLKMCLEIINKEKISGSKSFGTFRM